MVVKKDFTASEIKRMLHDRHVNNGDIFVDECKVGSTWLATVDKPCYRMDAWAMKKSWTSPIIWGYEIKVNRSDFLNDNKWQNYLLYCSDFYFVCPEGVIRPEELPEEVGLIIVKGNRFYTKKKAPSRNIDPTNLIGLFKYLMMNRIRITAECEFTDQKAQKLQEWKEELARMEDAKRIGWRVSRKIGKMVKAQVKEIQEENGKLKSENKALEVVKNFCEENKIDLADWNIKGNLRRVIGVENEDVIKMIEEANGSIREVAKKLGAIVNRLR